MTAVTDFVYIMSPSYSGSTLLTFLLAKHPAIGTVGELKATSMEDIDRYTCSCGTLIRQCGFWAQVAAEMGQRGMPFDVASFGTHFRSPAPLPDKLLRAAVRGPLLEGARTLGFAAVPAAHRALRATRERNRALVESIAAIRHTPVILDGSKDPVRLRHLLGARYWPIRTIHLTRDGRGTANSYMRHYATTMGHAAREWVRSQHECRRMYDRLPPDRRIRVRYEDLCTDTEAVLKELFAFLGLEGTVSGGAVHAGDQHIVGNFMRLRPDQDITLDEKWKDQLTPADLAAFERVAGALNRTLGYA